jgi:UDP-glucose 4-epimerase
LKFGRGLDNRRLKASGFTFKYTSREAILKLRAQQRLRPLLRSGGEPYRYERELEEFLRWSPAVRGAAASGASGNGPPLPGRDYDQLSAAELIEVVPSLEAEALRTLRRYEEAHQARASVLEVVDRTLARKGAG